jgi:hypothetical protein
MTAVAFVLFGTHVLSQVNLRKGERYIGLGSVESMDFDKGVLVLVVKPADGANRTFSIPAANIAYMEHAVEVPAAASKK